MSRVLALLLVGFGTLALWGCSTAQKSSSAIEVVPVAPAEEEALTLSIEPGMYPPVTPATTLPSIEPVPAAEIPLPHEPASTDTVEIEPLTPAGNPLMELGRKFHVEKDLRNARTAFTQALDTDLSFEEEREALTLLDATNAVLFTSADETGDLKTCTVESGDNLSKIADRCGSTWQMLRRLNGLSSNTIRVGQKLNVLKGSLSLRVRKDKYAMDLMLDGSFIKRYQIGVGKNDCTPEGEFIVKNRIPHPQDGSYAWGHPKHRLGSHWIGLKGAEGVNGYGIHGCPVELYGEIGTQCSEGCVRVTNENAEELFEILPIGAQVRITR